jgi:hypothetical protein
MYLSGSTNGTLERYNFFFFFFFFIGTSLVPLSKGAKVGQGKKRREKKGREREEKWKTIETVAAAAAAVCPDAARERLNGFLPNDYSSYQSLVWRRRKEVSVDRVGLLTFRD